MATSSLEKYVAGNYKPAQDQRRKYLDMFYESTRLSDADAAKMRDEAIHQLGRWASNNYDKILQEGQSEWSRMRQEFVIEDNNRKLSEFTAKAEAEQKAAMEQAQANMEANRLKAQQEAEQARLKAEADAKKAQEQARLRHEAEVVAQKKKFNNDFIGVKQGTADREDRAKSGSILSWLGLTKEMAGKSAAEVEKTLLSIGKQSHNQNMERLKNKNDVIDTASGRESVFDKMKRSLLSKPAGSK